MKGGARKELGIVARRNQLRELAETLFQRAIAGIRAWDPRVTLKKNIAWAVALFLLLLGWLLCRPLIGQMAAGAVCIEAAALLLLYGLVHCALRVTHSLPDFRQARPSLLSIAMFALISAFTTFFVARKVLGDRTVYIWDYVSYWSKTVEQSVQYLKDPFETLANMYESILQEDINTFICLFTSLPMQIFGRSFAAFALIVQIMFNLPATWLIATAGQKLIAKVDIRMPWWICYLVASLCPLIFFPSANAYADSFGLIFVAILLLLAVDFDWHHPQTAHVALMGLVLPFCLISRFYFSFFILDFAALLAVAAVVTILQTSKAKIERTFQRSVVAYVAITAVAVVLMLVCFSELLYRCLDTNFRLVYAAYNRGDLLNKFWDVWENCGGIVILTALAGAVAGCMHRRTRAVTLGLTAGMLLCCVLFFQIQYMGPQHRLLIAPTLALLMVMAVGALWNAVKKQPLRGVAVGACVCLLAANTVVGWSTIRLPQNNLYGLLVNRQVVSQRRDDIDALHELADCLNGLEGNVYVLASSETLNNQTLQYLDYPEKERAVERQFDACEVDTRDGFPMAFFISDVVVVADPPQYHLAPEDQRVVGALAQHFIDDTGFARHYEALKSFQLDDGITATVYQKAEDWLPEDYAELRAEFEGYYPDNPELFAERIRDPKDA